MALVMEYVQREMKTHYGELRLVTGINCRPESVYDDFLRTKLLYHKTDGTMFYHMVQSFPKGEKVDPVAAHNCALELAKELRAIGNNLNQLTALANMKQITVVYLDKVAEGLANISAAVRALQESRRW